MESPYACSLGLTSQFYYCGLPLRLDSYARCEFNCLYCFGKARGGARRGSTQQVADVGAFRRRLERLDRRPAQTVIEQLLTRRQPIHLGGMTDPLPPTEADAQVTLRLLETLAERGYPTIVSTKSLLASTPHYLEQFTRGQFVVQYSISSLDDRLMAEIDVGVPSPSERIASIATLARAGVPVSCRIQPLLPGHEADALDVIDASADAGAFHVAVEHLKLPVEGRWNGPRRLARALRRELPQYFAEARRIGREWVLPVERRLPRILKLRDAAHRRGLTFAAADNDLLLLSDGECCCSGAGELPGFESFFRFNYLEAARAGIPTNRVTYDGMAGEWLPQGSISSHVNSRSRLPAVNGRGVGIEPYLERNWTGSANGCSPMMFHGLRDTAEVDESGRPIYEFAPEALHLYRRAPAPARHRGERVRSNRAQQP